MKYYFDYKTVDLMGCTIVEGTRNFGGRERKNQNGKIVNNEGKRNFLLELDADAYEDFRDKNWNVGCFAARNENEEPRYFLRVNVSWYKVAPTIHMISEGNDTLLDEAHVHLLDSVNILDLDIRCTAVNKQNINTGEWKKNAFVDEMWVTVTPNRFASKYEYLHNKEEE